MVAARIARADQAACGPGEALRLPNVGELANEVESGLGERWLDTFVRIEDHTAAGDVTGRRLHPPGGGFVRIEKGVGGFPVERALRQRLRGSTKDQRFPRSSTSAAVTGRYSRFGTYSDLD